MATVPTPRFVYVLEGAVILEMDGKPAQTFKTGQAFVEPANAVHNFRKCEHNGTCQGSGVPVRRKGQPLQTNAP
jgi:quercetin dioxygenase-like cupin family protein